MSYLAAASWRSSITVRQFIITLKLTGAPAVRAAMIRSLDVLINVINIYTQKPTHDQNIHSVVDIIESMT